MATAPQIHKDGKPLVFIGFMISGTVNPRHSMAAMERIMKSQYERAIAPLAAEPQNYVTSILCMDEDARCKLGWCGDAANGTWRFTPDAFRITMASSQYGRLDDCVKHLLTSAESKRDQPPLKHAWARGLTHTFTGKGRRWHIPFDFVIRSRPDLYWERAGAPLSVAALSPQHVHVRIRCAGRNFTENHGLRSDALSWGWGLPEKATCLAYRLTHRDINCVTVDDQFAVVPQQRVAAYFKAIQTMGGWEYDSRGAPKDIVVDGKTKARATSRHSVCNCEAQHEQLLTANLFHVFPRAMRHRPASWLRPLHGLAFRLAERSAAAPENLAALRAAHVETAGVKSLGHVDQSSRLSHLSMLLSDRLAARRRRERQRQQLLRPVSIRCPDRPWSEATDAPRMTEAD